MEPVAAAAAVILLLLLLGDKSGGGGNKYDRSDLNISVDDNGNFIVSSKSSGETLFTGTLQECRDWIESNC